MGNHDGPCPEPSVADGHQGGHLYGIANPSGLILSGAMLLRHLGERAAGDRLEAAVVAALGAGEVTADLAGTDRPALGTTAFTDAVVSRLAT